MAELLIALASIGKFIAAKRPVEKKLERLPSSFEEIPGCLPGVPDGA